MLDQHLAARVAEDGVPTAIDSSARSDRLSNGEGTTTMVAASSAWEPFALREQTSELDPRHLGNLHQLDAHQDE